MASDLDFLEDFGVDPNSVQTKANFGNITSDIILEWLTDLKKELQDELFEQGVEFGGNPSNLASSIEFDVVDAATQLHWTVSMNDYWKWVENGRGPTTKSGGGPLQPKIAEWIGRKGISPVEWMKRINPKWKMPLKSKHTGDEFSFALRSLSSIITRNIHKDGYSSWREAKHGSRGAHFVKGSLTTYVPLLSKRLEIALGRRVEVSIKSALKNLK